MAAHIYATDSQTVINYLTDLHNTFGMSIWVTEFACEVRLFCKLFLLFLCDWSFFFWLLLFYIYIEFYWWSTMRWRNGFQLHEQPYTMVGLDSVDWQVFLLRSVWTIVIGKNFNLWRRVVSGLMTPSEININPLNALMNEDGTPSPLGNLYIGN